MFSQNSPTFHANASAAYRAIVTARLVALRKILSATLPADTAPICWEVGSGHGHFLTRYAALNPARLFVGIDLLDDRLRKAGKKAATSGLSNVRFIKAEALEFLDCLPEGLQIAETWVLFPDPWPKKRHHKNRLVQPGFLQALASRMPPGGRLYFRTDHVPYLEWAGEHIASHCDWRILDEREWPFEEKTVFQARATSFGSLVAETRVPAPEGKPAG